MAAPDTREKQYRVVQVLAYAILIAAPILYLIVAYLLESSGPIPDVPRQTILYILLGIAVLQVAGVMPLVTKSMMRSARSHRRDASGRAATALMVTLIRMVFIETVFLFGLIYFVLTRDFTSMLYFYAIGLLAVVLYWPTRERFDDLATTLETT